MAIGETVDAGQLLAVLDPTPGADAHSPPNDGGAG